MAGFELEHLTRQLEIIPPEVLGEPINIVGAGAVGSFTALALAKMGFCDITIYDFDNIEIENMNCQFYRLKDIGKSKVEALQSLVEDFTDVKIEIKNKPYKRGLLNGIVISAVDSMAVRKLIWEQHKERAVGTRIIIDPRMGAEFAMTFAMDPMDPADIASYEKTLYSDKNAERERCTAKSTIYTALLLSGYVAKIVKDVLTSPKYPRIMQWNIKGTDKTFESYGTENKRYVTPKAEEAPRVAG